MSLKTGYFVISIGMKVVLTKTDSAFECS